jgi:hypothetical protein
VPRAADLVLPRSDLRVLVTGGELGSMKPCGCSSPQMGGLARRAALWERQRTGAKAAAAISLGQSARPTDEPLQAQLKADLHAAALSAMGYDGVLLGLSELSQAGGPQPFVEPSERPRPPLNVKVKESGPLGAMAPVDPVLRFDTDGWRVRAVSVVDPTAQELVGAGVADAVIPPEVALAALPKEPGLLVVAAHAHRESLAMIVRAVEGKADVVVVVDMPGEAALSEVGPVATQRPLFVRLEDGRKEAGILDLARDGETWRASWRAVALDPSLEEGESALRDEVEGLYAVYRRRVREDGLLEKWLPFRDDGPSYVGSDACAACHFAIHASWKETAHAHALHTLEEKGYAWDPECVRCHVVGWRRAANGWYRTESGFHTPETTPRRADVGCEDCHGPGSQHVEDPSRPVWKPYGAEGAANWRHPGRRGCETCHDADNSPTFSRRYAEHYLPKVDHRDVPKEARTHPPR